MRNLSIDSCWSLSRMDSRFRGNGMRGRNDKMEGEIMAGPEPGGESSENEPTEQELQEDRYFRAAAEGLAEVIKSAQDGAKESQLRKDFSKLLSNLNREIRVNEDPTLYRPKVEAIIGYLGSRLFGEHPRDFISNPRRDRKIEAIENPRSRFYPPLSDVGGPTSYNFSRFKSNQI